MSADHSNTQNFKNEVLHSGKSVLLDFLGTLVLFLPYGFPRVEETANER